MTTSPLGQGLAQHLCALEESLLLPDVRKSQTLVELIADDFHEFGSSGRIYNKTDLVAALQAERPSTQTTSDFKVTELSPQVALLTYRIHRHGEAPVHTLRSSVWKHTEGRWQMVFHQATRTEPFHGQGNRQESDMRNGSTEVTTQVLQAFADAWNRHDVDALMSFMTDDCVFEASAGADVCGTRYAGREAVRSGFAEVWTTFPDARWAGARHFVFGDRGMSEWTFTGTRVDGTRVEVNGCDLFIFRDGKIAVKNAYRKNRLPVGGAKR